MTELANTTNDFLIPRELTTNEQYDSKLVGLSKAGDYLPRLQLFGANSDDVKKGLIPMAHYGIKRAADDIIDLGPDVIILLINWRPFAIRFMDDNDFVVFYDPESPAFKEIQATANADSNSGCQFGPQFLVYIPDLDEMATFFLGSKTARKIGTQVAKLLGKPAQLKSKFIESGKYSWHGPVILPWNAPLSRTPDMAKVTAEVQKFKNPPATEVEVATAAEERQR